MNKWLLICCLSYCSLFAYGQIVNGYSFSWSRLPVTSEDFQICKGNGETLYNSVGEKGFQTSQLYNINKGNVSKFNVLFYSIEEKFGEPVLSTEAHEGFEVRYSQTGRALREHNWGLEWKAIPGGFGGNIEFGNKGISEITYYDDEKIIYDYNNEGYVETVTCRSLIFKYAYVPNTNRISSVIVYDGSTAKESGRVNYVYDSQGRLVGLYGTNKHKGKNEKQIKYDSQGNISYLRFTEHSLGGVYMIQTYVYNNHYNEKGILYKAEYQYICEIRNNNRSPFHRTSSNFVSSYEYDALGNWIEVTTVDEKGIGICTKRIITYREE